MTPYDTPALEPDGLEDGVARDRVEDPGRGLLTMTLGQARFGLWVDEVLEILRTPPITRLPLPAPAVAGVTSVRGVVVPVLDLGQRLVGTPARRPGRLVLVRHEETDSLVGLLVDDVGTLLGVRPDEVRPPPPEAEVELPPGMVTGVVAGAGGLVTVLHIGEAAAPPTTETEDGWG